MRRDEREKEMRWDEREKEMRWDEREKEMRRDEREKMRWKRDINLRFVFYCKKRNKNETSVYYRTIS